MERAFKGVWINKAIWEDENLTWNDKCLLAEVDSLDSGDGCFASNEYLAEKFRLSVSRIANQISGLRKRGYIVDVSFDGRQRRIAVADHLRSDGKNTLSEPDGKAALPESGKAALPECGNSTIREKIREKNTGGLRAQIAMRESDIERMKEIKTATDYEPDGLSPIERRAIKRRLERSLGITRSTKWSQLLFGSAYDFKNAFATYMGYEYTDVILLDEIAKTLASWYEKGETRESIRKLLLAFFEGKDKVNKITVTPRSVFTSHTYNAWKQGKL